MWSMGLQPINFDKKCCKHILKVKPSTPNFMVYGELGRFPILINIKVWIISFWCKLIAIQSDKLSSQIFFLLRNYNSPWCNFIKSISNECGLSYIWQTGQPLITRTPWLKKVVFNTLYDQFKQLWYCDVFNPSKGIINRIFKTSFSLESYLLNLPFKYLKYFCRFRTCNIKLPVEVGRWFNIPREIEL